MNVFTKEYWVAACGELRSLRKLAFAALICAITVVMDGLIKVPLFPGQEIKFTFFVIALGCAVYGPVAGMAIATIVDILSFVIFPPGGIYFPGYLFTELLVVVFYSAFLYRRQISVWKIFGAKVCTNFFAHVAFNTLWASILYDKGYLYYLSTSLIKNALLLPAEVLLLALFFKAVLPIFSRMKLLPEHSDEAIGKLNFTDNVFPVLGFSALIGGIAGMYYGVVSEGGAIFKWLGIGLLAAGLALLIIGVVFQFKKKKKLEEASEE